MCGKKYSKQGKGDVMEWRAKKTGKWTFEVNPEVSGRIGKGRQGIHPNGTPRFFEDKNEEDIIGVKPELAFECLTGLKMDETLRRNGDGGIDFKFICDGREYYLDVKGARKPVNLLLKVEEEKNKVHILVLSKVESNTVTFLGWEWKCIVMTKPIDPFFHGINNHYLHHKSLIEMDSLIDAIRKKEGLPPPVYRRPYVPSIE